MENERRDEEFTIVLNRWHMPYRRGSTVCSYAAPYQTFCGRTLCAPTVTHLQMILVWEHTFYHHDNSPFSIFHSQSFTR